MDLGSNRGTYLNPWALEDMARTYQGFTARAFANAIVNVEQELVAFGPFSRPLRLARVVFRCAWAGSPAGVLYIRANGELLEEYYQQWTSDTPVGFQQRHLYALVPAYARASISFLNLTDTGNPRPIFIAVSGWFEDDLTPKGGALP